MNEREVKDPSLLPHFKAILPLAREALSEERFAEWYPAALRAFREQPPEESFYWIRGDGWCSLPFFTRPGAREGESTYEWSWGELAEVARR